MRKRIRLNGRGYFHITLLLLLTCMSLSADDKIVFGTTTALTGPSKFLGQSMVRGMKAHFSEINDRAGSNEPKIHFIERDDSYDPSSAAQNANYLLEQTELLALVGNVGTPTAKAVLPLLKTHQKMLFGAFSGASILRSEGVKNYAKNFRASYAEETELIIETILNRGISANEIALLTQNDSYGTDGYCGVMKSLGKRGLYKMASQAQESGPCHTPAIKDDFFLEKHSPDVVERIPQGGEDNNGECQDMSAHAISAENSPPRGCYNRSTLNIEGGLLKILGSQKSIRAIIIIGTYRPSAKFIRMAHKVFPQAEFYTVSFIGANPFAKELARQLAEEKKDSRVSRSVKKIVQHSEPLTDCTVDCPIAVADTIVNQPEIFISQVVPPLNSQLPAVVAYRKAMDRFSPEAPLDEVSLEGYLVARLLLAVVKRAGEPLDAKALSRVLATTQTFDIGLGKPLEFGGQRKQASDQVWMSRFDGSRFVSLP